MRGNKKLALLALIAYGVIATVLIFNFLSHHSNDTSQDRSVGFKDALDIMLRANEAQCFEAFVEDLSAKAFGNDMLRQRKIGELVRCLQKNYLKLQQIMDKDSGGGDSAKPKPIELKFLPVYSAETYSTPVEVDWYDYEDYDAYMRTMTDELTLSVWSKAFDKPAHKRLMRLFRILTELFYKQKMEYMLTEGSLMGSLRHFDQIPWDDDAVSLYLNFNYHTSIFNSFKMNCL